MNEALEKLLQPVSAEQPCGPDLANDPRMLELEELLKGTPEREMGEIKVEAEPPDWREVRNQAMHLLEQSKDLQVAVVLCCSLLRTEGLPGFRNGLELIRGFLESFWPTLYPPLDVEDNNDPTLRLNRLRSLTAPRASVGGWLKPTDYLYEAPLCQPKGLPPITLVQLQGAGGEGGPSRASLEAAMRDAPPDQLAGTLEALHQALAAAQGIDEFLTTTLGSGQTISFDVLTGALNELIGTVQPLVAGGSLPSGAEGQGPGADTAGGGAGAAMQISGAIRSRQDVVQALERVCDYYRQVEPGSPVPYLLRRAQKLAGMSFVQAVQELNVGTLDSLKPSLGSAVDEEAASSETASS
jgi:type VI secretion system protein ImpA